MHLEIQRCKVEMFGHVYSPRVFHLVHGRILVVAGGFTLSNANLPKDKQKKGGIKVPPGSLLYSRWIGNGQNRKRIYISIGSIYTLLRMYEHAESSGQRSRGTMILSIETAIAVVKDLLWHSPLKGNKLSARDRDRLKRLLSTLEERYRHASNEKLGATKEKIRAAVEMKDSRGRFNPRSTAARVTSAIGRYDVRLEEIMRIVPHLSYQRIVVLGEIERIWSLLDQDYRLLKSMLGAIERVRESWHTRWILSALRAVQEHIDTIRVAPFYRNHEYLRDEIDKAIQLVSGSPWSPIVAHRLQQFIRIMIASIEFKKAQRGLERIIYRASRRQHANSFSPWVQERARVAVLTFMTRAINKLNEDAFPNKRLSRVKGSLGTAARAFGKQKPEEAIDALRVATELL